MATTRFPRSMCQGKLKWLVVAGVFAVMAAACGDTAKVITTTAPPVAPPETGALQPPTTTAPQVPTTTAAEARAIELTRDIAYSGVMQLDVYAPSEPGPWPVVIAVHGYGGSRDDFAGAEFAEVEGLAEAIASEGAVVFNLDVTMIEPFLTAIEQVACAVRFARATAAGYGGDPTSITLVGGSGGAAVGAVVALAGDDYGGDCAVTDGSALPDALVGYEGPYDWAIRVYDPELLDPRLLEVENPELLEAINPYSHIGDNPNVVFRLIHGIDVDETVFDVPPEVSTEFYQTLTDAGYDVELTLLEGASHFDFLSYTQEAFEVTLQQVLEAARR